MSVYIKGMEMPTSCYVCPFCDYVSARCDAVKGNPYTPESRYEKRADFCPLVPVPPHGRTIDADALDDILADQSEDAYNQTHAPRSWERALSAMRDYLDNAPTIIPADKADKEGEE